MKRIFFWWLLLLSGLAYAGNVNEQQARKVAVSFLNLSPQSRASESALQMVLNSESLSALSERSASPAYYVFDDIASKGFVIVSGDDAVRPILAYSFEEDFPQGTLPPNLQEWLKHVRREINDARRNGLLPDASVTRTWSDLRVGNAVVELETARWNQEEPYNQLCPTYSGRKTYTGCTATALAIAMRYHQWPGRGVGTLLAYTTGSYGIRVNSIAVRSACRSAPWARAAHRPDCLFSSARGRARDARLRRNAAVRLRPGRKHGYWCRSSGHTCQTDRIHGL